MPWISWPNPRSTPELETQKVQNVYPNQPLHTTRTSRALRRPRCRRQLSSDYPPPRAGDGAPRAHPRLPARSSRQEKGLEIPPVRATCLHAKLRSAATWSTQTPKEGLMPRYQQGSIRQIKRAEGMAWVLRYYTTRTDGKRVEHMVSIGLVRDIGPKKADASREADRQKLRETINQVQPFQGKPSTFGQLTIKRLSLWIGKSLRHPDEQKQCQTGGRQAEQDCSFQDGGALGSCFQLPH